MGIVLDSKRIQRKPRLAFALEFIAAVELSYLTSTSVAGGSGALVSLQGGALRITGAATTNNSGNQYQVPNPYIKQAAGQHTEIAASTRPNHASALWSFGYSVPTAAIITTPPTDGIWLSRANDGTVNLTAMRGSVAVTKSLGIIASDIVNFHTWQLQIRTKSNAQQGSVKVYLDGAFVFDDAAINDFLNLPFDQIHAPFIAAQSGTALGTQTVDFDWFYVSADR
jgi:hypothetical protein